MFETRRQFVGGLAAGAATSLGFAATSHASGAPEAARDTATAPPWPSHAPELAREMVGVSHGNVGRVEELLARQPTLANAAWDWGFGDWETALGAASHVGNQEIAELLLASGARPTIFSAAMLGQLEVVRALVAAAPGSQRTLGPHGLTLLHHARAGGERATEVARWLEGLGDADPKLESAPLDADQETAILGSYRFGPGESDRIEIARGRQGLSFQRAGATPRPILHRGGLAFSPAGAPRVRIRFRVEQGRALALAVDDPGEVLTASRI